MRSLRTAQDCTGTVRRLVVRYSSPATAALGRLLLPYPFPELSAFATVEDLVTHLCSSDARYHAALPADQDHFLALDPTALTVDLLEQHLLAAETSVVGVGAARGTLRTPFFEGCSPSPLAPSYASAAAVDVLGVEDDGAASADVAAAAVVSAAADVAATSDVSTTTTLRANPVLPDRASLKAKYKQRKLNFARPAGPTMPAPTETIPPATRQFANDDDDEDEEKDVSGKRRQLSVEELQLTCMEQWLRYFPWLYICETKDGRPCMRCSVCMVFGDPHYKYGRYGEGGIDIQKQTMRKHHHSIKHEAAVREKEQRDGLKKGQKSIVEFDKGDDDGKRIARLMAIALFICKSGAHIVLFVALVHFMAKQGTPDMPLKKENGTYYSEYGFAQLVETMAWFLRSRQLKHIRASPYLGIQLDKSTDRRRGKHMIVYMTFLHDNLPVMEFYVLLTVEQCDTASLQTILLTHLETMGIDLQRISDMSMDGASVMTGQHNGLVARLRSKIPHLVSCHCVAHRRVRV
ncbi:unnamed protein product [Closterium sp. NIES-54]